MWKRNRPNSQRAFTLIEVLMTLLIVSVAGMGIIASLAYGIYLKKSIRERNGAIKAASSVLEQTKRTFFDNLGKRTLNDVVIDDAGSPETEDDVTATVTLSFWDMGGNEVGTELAPLPEDRSMVEARVEATWSPSGRRSSSTQTITLKTLLAP